MLGTQQEAAPPRAPRKRAKKGEPSAAHLARLALIEEKARLLPQLQALVDKVPACVASGSIQKTREWVHDNRRARSACKRGSVKRIKYLLGVMQQWQRGEPIAREAGDEPTIQ